MTNTTNNEVLLNEYLTADDERKSEIEGILLEENICLVYSYLRKNKIQITDDIVQEGLIGLINAIRNWNGNTKFSTYSFFWIKNKILRHIKNNKMIRIPAHIKDSDCKMRFCTTEKATLKESEKGYNEYVMIVDSFKETLNKRDKEMLELYLEGFNYREISQMFNLTPQRVVQIMQKIQAKIKEFVGGKSIGMEF